MCEKAVIDLFKALSQNFVRETEENHETRRFRRRGSNRVFSDTKHEW